jgi:hypothetical protein
MANFQLTAKLVGYGSEGVGEAFSDGVDVSWDSYYDLKAEVERVTHKTVGKNLTISGHPIHRSRTVPNECVWPCNCIQDQEKPLEEQELVKH